LSVGLGVLIAIIRQFHWQERCAFQRAGKRRRAGWRPSAWHNAQAYRNGV